MKTQLGGDRGGIEKEVSSRLHQKREQKGGRETEANGDQAPKRATCFIDDFNKLA